MWGTGAEAVGFLLASAERIEGEKSCVSVPCSKVLVSQTEQMWELGWKLFLLGDLSISLFFESLNAIAPGCFSLCSVSSCCPAQQRPRAHSQHAASLPRLQEDISHMIMQQCWPSGCSHLLHCLRTTHTKALHMSIPILYPTASYNPFENSHPKPTTPAAFLHSISTVSVYTT